MNILVSACLLGTPCRYDGTGKLEPALERLRAQGHTWSPSARRCWADCPPPVPRRSASRTAGWSPGRVSM